MSRARAFRRYRGWIALGAVVAVAATVFFMWRSANAENEPTTTYTTETAEKGTLQVTVSGTGNLEIADQTEVWPETAGTVDSIAIAEGDAVKKGDVLFTLDDGDAAAATTKALAEYRQSQSQVAQAEAQVTKAESALDALEDRADSPTSTVTSAEIKAAKADITSAKASLSSAKASRSSALDSYNDALDAENELEVVAPVSGVVYSLDVDEGDSVAASSGSSSSSSASAAAASASSASSGSSSSASASTPIVIVPNKPLVATLAINEVDLPSLKKGQRADLEFDALPDLTLTGKVTDIADEGTVESGVVSFDVEIALDVRNKQLRPGMSVSATIVTAVARDVLLVSNAAVKTDDNDGSYVQVLDSATNQPRQVSVEAGMSGDTQTEIVSGLDEGAAVITATSDSSDGGESDRPGGGFMMMGGGPR